LRGTGLFLTESLTKRRSALFKAARDKFGVRNTWTKDGKIFVAVSPEHKKVLTDFVDLDVLLSDCEVVRDSDNSKSVRVVYNTRGNAKAKHTPMSNV